MSLIYTVLYKGLQHVCILSLTWAKAKRSYFLPQKRRLPLWHILIQKISIDL